MQPVKPKRWWWLAPPAVACLTLGLAPFAPEPHVVEKWRRLLTAPGGLRPIDWFDLVLHSAPWLWLLGTAARLRGRAGADPRTPDGVDA